MSGRSLKKHAQLFRGIKQLFRSALPKFRLGENILAGEVAENMAARAFRPWAWEEGLGSGIIGARQWRNPEVQAFARSRLPLQDLALEYDRVRGLTSPYSIRYPTRTVSRLPSLGQGRILIRDVSGIRVIELPNAVQLIVKDARQAGNLRHIREIVNPGNKHVILRVLYTAGHWANKDAIQSKLLGELIELRPASIWLQLERKLTGLTTPFEGWNFSPKLFAKVFALDRPLRLTPEERYYITKLFELRARLAIQSGQKLELPLGRLFRIGGVDLLRDGDIVYVKVSNPRWVPPNLLDLFDLRGKHVIVDAAEVQGWPHSDRATAILITKAAESDARTVWGRVGSGYVNVKGYRPGKLFGAPLFERTIRSL